MCLGFNDTLFLLNRSWYLGQGIVVYTGTKSLDTLINHFPPGWLRVAFFNCNMLAHLRWRLHVACLLPAVITEIKNGNKKKKWKRTIPCLIVSSILLLRCFWRPVFCFFQNKGNYQFSGKINLLNIWKRGASWVNSIVFKLSFWVM